MERGGKGWEDTKGWEEKGRDDKGWEWMKRRGESWDQRD